MHYGANAIKSQDPEGKQEMCLFKKMRSQIFLIHHQIVCLCTQPHVLVKQPLLKKGGFLPYNEPFCSISHMMFSSPILNSCDSSSPWNDSKDDSLPEPTMCSCQNQLAHWDWNGIVHKDLLELCKKFFGDAPTSQKNGE